MADLGTEVRIKLIEVSREWAGKVADHKAGAKHNPLDYPKEFDAIYKQLTKTISEAMTGE